MSDPILILAQPRSGSSMTAGIFHHHGVWTGTCRPGDDANAKGHFENIPLRTLLIGQHKAIVHKGVLAKPIAGFKQQALQTVRNDGYTNGPWLWKGSVLYYPAFFEFDYTAIGVIRPREQIFRSCRRSHMFGGNMSDSDLYANIDFQQQQINEVCQAIVYTDEIVNGNYRSLENALDTCGLVMDPSIVNTFIDTKLWHSKTSPTTTA